MSEIRCRECNSVVAVLAPGTDWVKGTEAICRACLKMYTEKCADIDSNELVDGDIGSNKSADGQIYEV